MKLEDLSRKQVLTIIAIPLMILALFALPVLGKKIFQIPTLYTAFGMIFLYFLLDQYMKRS